MFLAADQRGIVVFKLVPSLPYGPRMALAFALVLGGFALQLLLLMPFVGGALILAGNLFLLVTGYDNRVQFDAFDPSAEWQRVERDKLAELRALDRKITTWDRSSLDISNVLGFLVLAVIVSVLGIGALVSEGAVRVLFIDGLLLLVPHWVTGTRTILTLPGLLVKTDFILELTELTANLLGKHRVHYLMLLSGGEAPIPDDVKIKVALEGQHPDFMGLYGQVVTNDVQGTSYPYFYVVLVAKRGYGLDRVQVDAPTYAAVELAPTEEVDVLVIRQFTTDRSGYHTDVDRAAAILQTGLRVAERACAGPVA